MGIQRGARRARTGVSSRYPPSLASPSAMRKARSRRLLGSRMDLAPPPAPGSRIEELDDRLLVPLGPRRSWGGIAFLMFWVTLWTFGGMTAFDALAGAEAMYSASRSPHAWPTRSVLSCMETLRQKSLRGPSSSADRTRAAVTDPPTRAVGRRGAGRLV